MTKGIISGWIDDNHINKGWIKTDAEINPGNSGGMALNKQGQLIGIPTAGVYNKESVGKLGLIRPINLVKNAVEI